VTKSAGPGAPVNVVAQTEPNADGTIEFFYSDGSKSTLVFAKPAQKADATGKLTFTGEMYRHVRTGPATLKVTVKAGGKESTFTTTMEVTAV